MAESILDRFENSSKAEQIDNARRGQEPITQDKLPDDELLNRARKGAVDTNRYSDRPRR